MRLVIADDHRVVRDGIRYMLADAPGIEIAGEASSGEELIELLETDPVDVVLLDVRMPGMNGFDVLERLQEGLSQVRVIMLSMHDAPGYVRRAIELGAAGYLLKSASRDEVIAAIDAVLEGGAYVQGELVQPLVNELASCGNVYFIGHGVDLLQFFVGAVGKEWNRTEDVKQVVIFCHRSEASAQGLVQARTPQERGGRKWADVH